MGIMAAVASVGRFVDRVLKCVHLAAVFVAMFSIAGVAVRATAGQAISDTVPFPKQFILAASDTRTCLFFVRLSWKEAKPSKVELLSMDFISKAYDENMFVYT